MINLIGRKQAQEYLKLDEKTFKNYFQFSKEIIFTKIKNRYLFDKKDLDSWNYLKSSRTVTLDIKEYEECFEFAIKMAYSTKASHGTGIRGVRSEVQMADDFILGILAEHGIQKLLEAGDNVFEFTPKTPGKISFMCSMGMIRGEFTVIPNS